MSVNSFTDSDLRPLLKVVAGERRETPCRTLTGGASCVWNCYSRTPREVSQRRRARQEEHRDADTHPKG